MGEEGSSAVEAPEVGGRRAVRDALRGGRKGLRWASFLIRPVALVVGLLALVPTTFGLGAGGGLSVHRAAAGAVGFYLACLAWGFVAGVAVGLLGRLGAAGRADGRPPWWDRPLTFRPGPLADESDRPPRSEVWFRREARLARWIAGLGLALLGVALGVGFAAHRLVAARLAAAIADADRDDPNWRLDDLLAARPPVPDEENGALVVAEVVDLLGGDWPPGREPGRPAPSTALQEALGRSPPVPSAALLDEAAAAAIREALDERAEAVARARALAGSRRGRHELVVPTNPIATLLPETQAARGVGRLLDADAALRAHDGRIDDAFESVRAILGVARSIGDEPFLISGLVRTAIHNVGRNALRRAMALGEASPAALEAVQAVLIADRAEPPLLIGVRGERAILDAVLTRIRAGELSIGDLSAGGASGSAGLASWGQLLFDHQRAVGLEWHNQAVRIARLPAAERPAPHRAWHAEVMRVKDGNRLAMLGAALPLLMMPALDAAMTNAARHDAELGASILLIAAERHRLAHGDWPAGAASIDPAILPDPPLDPFTKEPYRMGRRDGRLLIYSVGPNLRDEAGAFDPRTFLQGTADDYGTGAWDASRRRQPPTRAEPGPGPGPDAVPAL